MKPGDLYKHFKGNVYRIVTLATREEDMELVVVYERADGSSERPWVRTASSFLSITPSGDQRFAPFTAELTEHRRRTDALLDKMAEEALTMPIEDIKAELRAEGKDPVEVAARMRARVDELLAKSSSVEDSSAVLSQMEQKLCDFGMAEAIRGVAVQVIAAVLSTGQQLRSLWMEEDIVIASFSPWLRMEMNEGRCLLKYEGDSYSYIRRVTTQEEALSFIQGLKK
jgi:hypothetical protein